LDNVFIERFWRSLKQEKIYRLDLVSVKEAKDAISEYMKFYVVQWDRVNTLAFRRTL
jgi:putative transposase